MALSGRGRIDALGCLVLLLVAQTQIWAGWSDGGVGTPSPGVRALRAALLLLTVGPLVWRRRSPLTVVAVICSAMVVQLLAVTPSLPFLGALLPMAVANYTVAAYARRWPISGLVLTLSTEAVIYAVIPEERVLGELLFSVFVIVGTWLAGDVVRNRLVRADREVRSAHDLSNEQTTQALSQERALMARELHDVIAHSVSVMGVQAGAARTLLDAGSTAASREAILAIETTARSSVAELQRLLSVLRDAEHEPGVRAPAPGLGMVPGVVEQVRAAGLPVRVELDPLLVLPAGLDLVAFRIVQEALTNALKHAAAATTVSVSHTGGQLHIDVRNEGAARAQRSALGHGLIGMRERVQLYGGTLTAGPLPSGGYAVTACLPLETRAELALP